MRVKNGVEYKLLKCERVYLIGERFSKVAVKQS